MLTVPVDVTVIVALVEVSKGLAPVAKLEPLGSVTFMVVPELLVRVNVSPASKVRVVEDKVSEYGPPPLPVHVIVMVEGDAAA